MRKKEVRIVSDNLITSDNRLREDQNATSVKAIEFDDLE
jgi:hypothetical protein